MKKLLAILLLSTSFIYSGGQYRPNTGFLGGGTYYDDSGTEYEVRNCGFSTRIYGSNGYEGEVRSNFFGGYDIYD